MINVQEACWACDRSSIQYSRVRIFVPWVSGPFLAIFDGILTDLASCQHEVELYDVAQFSYPRWSLSAQDLINKLSRHRDLRVRSIHRGLDLDSLRKRPRDVPDWLLLSSSSEIRTKYQGELPKSLGWLASLEARLAINAANSLFSKLLDLDVEPTEIWVYPNGRFSAQRAILEASKKHGLVSFCYERSPFSSKFYLRPYRSHDRLAGQEDFRSKASKVRLRSQTAAKKWILERTSPQSETNPFASNFVSSDFSRRANSKTVTFFTSSQDELVGLGADWSSFGWNNEYEAYSNLGHEFRKQGFKTVLRLHPNLANKSYEDLRNDYLSLLKLKAEGFRVVGPQDPSNSYKLASSSWAVVVSRSTIGIEALGLGIPVVATANSYYDHLKSLICVGKGSDFSQIESLIKRFDRSTASQEALTWLGFNFEQDLPLRETFDIKPKFSQRARNLLNADVAIFHGSAIFLRLIFYPGRRLMLRKIAQASSLGGARG